MDATRNPAMRADFGALILTAQVLIISTDPAHSLGDALAERLNGKPRQVAENLFAMEALRRPLCL